jgi:hypothetical protein
MEKPTQDGMDLNARRNRVPAASVSHRLTTTGCDSRAVLYLHRGRGRGLYRLFMLGRQECYGA